jgi:TM2 domain-containing membrane protein YozV
VNFWKSYSHYFPSNKIYYISEALKQIPEEKLPLVVNQDYKNPKVVFWLSLLFGWLAIDRFYIGNIILGLLKLLTGITAGFTIFITPFLILTRYKLKSEQTSVYLFILLILIWWFTDLFLIGNAARKSNYKKLNKIIHLLVNK